MTLDAGCRLVDLSGVNPRVVNVCATERLGGDDGLQQDPGNVNTMIFGTESRVWNSRLFFSPK